MEFDIENNGFCPLLSNQEKLVACSSKCAWYTDYENMRMGCALHQIAISLKRPDPEEEN